MSHTYIYFIKLAQDTAVVLGVSMTTKFRRAVWCLCEYHDGEKFVVNNIPSGRKVWVIGRNSTYAEMYARGYKWNGYVWVQKGK